MQTSRNHAPEFLARIAAGAVAFTLCCLPAFAQSSPPTMVQVPFVSLAAGDITSSGSNSTSASSACTNGLKTTGNSSYGDGCPATEAGVSTPWGAAVDKWGNVYFADEGHIYVRVIYAGPVSVDGVTNPAAQMIVSANPTQSLSTTTLVAGDVYALAGGYTGNLTESSGSYYCNNTGSGTVALTSAGSGCPATQSYLKGPYDPAVDSEGNVFVIDKSNSLIYVVLANTTGLAAQLVSLEDPTATLEVGSIYLIVGTGGGYKDGVLATSAEVHAPEGITVDSSENLYIGDVTNNAVRMVNGPDTTSGGVGPGYIHTIAGNCGSSSCTAESTGAVASGVPALGAGFDAPIGIAVDASGNVYVGDNSAATSGLASTVRVIYAGGTNNPLAPLICLETGIGSNCSSSLTAGDIYTIAGSGTSSGNSATGNGGMANAAVFDRIQGLALDQYGNLYINDYGSHSVIAKLNTTTGYLAFIAGDGQSNFGLNDYCSTGSSTGTGPTMSDKYGDGCPAPQSITDHIEGNPGIDSNGNLYFADNGDNLVRELTFSNPGSIGAAFPATAVNTAAATQDLAFLLLTGSSSESASGLAVSVLTQGTANADFTDPGTTADTCTGQTINGATSTGTSSSGSVCVVPIAFTPAKAGERAGAVEISGTVNSTTQALGSVYLSGTGNGAALVIDPVSSVVVGSGTAPQGVAADSSGNTYIAFAGSGGNGTVVSTPGGSLTTAGAGLSSPYQVAVDGAGNVYVADSGNNRIAEFTPGNTTAATVSTGGFTLSAPRGVAVDAYGNLYIADTGNSRVLYVPNGNGEVTQIGADFQTPVAVAVDGSGNVYVADSGEGAIFKIAAGNGAQTAVLTSVSPVGLAVDAAGDVDYVDSALGEVVEIPVSGANTPVVTGLTTPIGVAIDPNGGLYVADSSNTGIDYYSRTASTQAFASTSATVSATLTNIGNESYSDTASTPTQTDSTDFSLAAAATNGCDVTSTLTLAPGANCGVSATFVSTSTGNFTDTVTFAGNAVNTAGVTLNLSENNVPTAVGTTTSVGNLSPASPTYGQSVSVVVTVSQNSGSNVPTGDVTITVDGTAQTPVALTNGSYTLILTSLSAGDHTISASYPGYGSFESSQTTSNFRFTVAPIALTATASPLTVTYGQSIPAITGTLGSGVLAADAGNVMAVFSTSATSTSPVGSYPISVSLTGSAAANYTVTLSGTPAVTVQPATVNVTVANSTKVYGSANPGFSATFNGVLAADAANVSGVYSTTATAASAVGSYSVTVTGLTGSAAGNYTLGTVTPGSLSVTPLALTASATPVSAAYGQAIPSISGTLNGVLAQDTGNVAAVFSTTATSTSPPGSYPISVSLTGSAAGNYTVTLSGSPAVTITAAAVSVVVNNASRAYGAANPTFTGTLSGVLAQDAANVSAVYSTTATATSSVGSYPITATSLTGSAAGNYSLGAVTAGTLTVAQAGTTTSLTTSNSTVALNGNVTFTATVASTTTGTPAGSVTFYSGSTALGTLALTDGVATLSNPSITQNGGTYSITAEYGGTTNFGQSTSNAVTETVAIPAVGATPSSQNVTINSGSSGTVTLSLSAQGGYTGTATFSCLNLPAGMSCSFNPSSATFTSTTTTASTTLTISTSGSSGATAELARPALPGAPNRLPLLPAFGLWLPGALVGLFGVRSRRLREWQRRTLLLLVVLGGMAVAGAISGCGGSSGASKTPAGTYTIDVEITAGTVQMVPLTVTVQN